MSICHTHNLVKINAGKKPWGLRLTLPSGDALSSVIGSDFESMQWFATRREREQAIEVLRKRFPYYRSGDLPTYVIDRIDPDQDADAAEAA